MLEDPIVKDQFLIGSDTVFDFGHRIFSPSDITCYVYDPATGSETMLTSGTDFSVGLKPETTDYSNGARVTLLTEQPAAGKLTVVRTVVPEQGVALPNFGKIPSESLEAQLDRTIASVQQLHDTVQLAYKIPYGQSGTTTPEDEIKKMISSGGGGGGGGSSYEFNSSEFDVTSGGSVSIKKINKDKVDGLGYAGPFAVVSAGGSVGEAVVNVASGTFVLENTRYTVSGSSGITLENGDYLCLSGSYDTVGHSAYFGYWVGDPDDTSISSNSFLTKIAENRGGEVVQIQFGEITCVPWGASGGSSGNTLTKINFSSAVIIEFGSHYTTGNTVSSGGYTYTHVGSGLGGVLMGTVEIPYDADDTWNLNLSIGETGDLCLLNPRQQFVSSGTSVYGPVYFPRNTFVYIPIDPETKFHAYVNDPHSAGLLTSSLKFYPRVPLNS